MLFAAGWLLLAFSTLPAPVSGAVIQEDASAGIAPVGTFPLLDTSLVVRQAHVAWLAGKEDAGMQVTMRYLAQVNGSTATLSSINRDFRVYLEAVRHASTDERLGSGIAALCSTMESFRQETRVQLNAAGGDPEDLRAQVQAAVAQDPVSLQLEDQYWETRTEAELSGFDQWTREAGMAAGQLQESGYEVTPAQEKLAEITAMRAGLENALRIRDDTGIEQAREAIHGASITYATLVRDAKKVSSEQEEMGNVIDQSEGVLTRSGMMNADLQSLGVNCTLPQQLVATGHDQIRAVQTRMNAGNAAGAREALAEFQGTLQCLRDHYRGILIREDLPQTTAQGVLSVAQSLDVMSVRVSGE